jgi:DNA-binding beta-propeller fold protein YncE
VGLDGKIIKADWVSNLTAAKGLGLYKNLLYAAEQTTVAVIDVNTAAIVKRIPVEGAKFLNDITVDAKGIVYVSDSQTARVHKIENNQATVYLENMKGVNGLLAMDTQLYVLADGVLQKVDANKKAIALAQGMEGGTDGIVNTAPQEFIVTGWAGVIYYVKADGSTQLLLDTRDKKMNTADLGYNPGEKIIYVPTFSKNSVVAFKIK